MSFLAYDSPFMSAIRRIVDYMYLGVLWMIASLPIITFGAATTAALQTAEMVVRTEEGKMFRSFWKRFAKEFKQATILWIIELPALAILLTDVWLVTGSEINSILRGFIYVATVVVFCWIQLWFGYLSKFEDKTKVLLSNTFRMMLGSFGRSFLMGVLAVVAVVACVLCFFLMPPLLLLIPGFYIMGYTALMRKLFAKFLPKEETDEVTAEAPAEIPAGK